MKGKSTEDEQQKSGENDKSKIIIREIQSKIVTRNKVKLEDTESKAKVTPVLS